MPRSFKPAWAWRRFIGKSLSVLRLMKSALTFDDPGAAGQTKRFYKVETP